MNTNDIIIQSKTSDLLLKIKNAQSDYKMVIKD